MSDLKDKEPGWYWVKVAALKNWECGHLSDAPPPVEVDEYNYARPGLPVPPERRLVVTPTEHARVECVLRWGVRLEPPTQMEREIVDHIDPGWYWGFVEPGRWICGRVLPYETLFAPTGTLFSTAWPHRSYEVRHVLGWVRLAGPDVSDAVAHTYHRPKLPPTQDSSSGEKREVTFSSRSATPETDHGGS